LAKVANCSVCLIKYDLDQPPPPDKCLPGQTDYVLAHLVFSPDKPILYPEARVHLRMAENFHKEWIFMIVTSYKLCEVNISLYTYT